VPPAPRMRPNAIGQALRATQGVRLERDATFLTYLATAQTGDGRALPAPFRLWLEREWAHLRAMTTPST
jgi:hypothetical protein